MNIFTWSANTKRRVLLLFPAFLCCFWADAQVSSVHGVVTSADNDQPLVGATVQVQGKTTGTVTNNRGAYELSATAADTLVFHYIGYNGRKVAVGEKATINVALTPTQKGLSEVVVVGYGTQRRTAITGSIASVSAEDLQDIPVPSFSEALAGRMAGVRVQQTSAAPGGGISIIVRGVGSISAGNAPLYVIDGVPVDNVIGGAAAQGKNEGSQSPVNPLSSININDIESIDVLKDASATAIYGSRGSNGVVIITTKQGQPGKPKLQLNASTGWQTITHKIPILGLKDFVQMQKDVINMGYERTGGSTSDPNSARPPGYWIPNEYNDLSLNTYHDWQDILYRTAPIQNYQLSASGGSKEVHYYLSGNYVNQQGLIRNSWYKRYGLRANVDADISERFHVGLRLTPSYSTSNINQTGGIVYYGGVVTTALNTSPLFPPYNPDGSFSFSAIHHYTIGDSTTTRRTTYSNPLATTEGAYRQFDQFRTLGTLFVNIDLLKSLKFKSSINADINVFNSNEFRSSNVMYHGSLPPNDPRASTFNSRNISWVNENTLTYNNTFNGSHNLEVLLGLSEQKSTFISSSIEDAYMFPNDRVRTINAAGALKSASSLASAWSLTSVFGRVRYNYKQKYLFTATLRQDGSSRFGSDTKWGAFPSASIGWRISQEDFIKNSSTISDFKVRASYGLTGNNQIADYASYGLVAPANYILGSGDGQVVNGLAQATISNPDLSWEKAKEFDLGLNLGLFNSRIYLTADYYNRLSSGLLLNVPVPFSTGFSTALRNIGKVRNKGFELAIQSRNIDNNRFKWNTDFNISFNRNKVVALGPDNAPIFAANTNVDNSIITLTKVGEPIGSFYGYKWIGMYLNEDDLNKYPHWSSNLPGDLRYKDMNGDGEMSIADKTIIGDNYPDYTFGINNTLTFRNFDLSILVQGVQGVQVLNLKKRQTTFRRYVTYFKNYWRSPQQPGDGKTPSLIASGNSREISSWMVEDASYVRIKNLTLGYAVPQKWVKQARVYINIQNLYTFTNYHGYNPEVNTMGNNLPIAALIPGTDYGTYPLARIFTAGVSLTF